MSTAELGRKNVVGELGDMNEVVDFLGCERTQRVVVVADGMAGGDLVERARGDLVERARVNLQEHHQMVQISVCHRACNDSVAFVYKNGAVN